MGSFIRTDPRRKVGLTMCRRNLIVENRVLEIHVVRGRRCIKMPVERSL
jgi:hypothetical protein